MNKKSRSTISGFIIILNILFSIIFFMPDFAFAFLGPDTLTFSAIEQSDDNTYLVIQNKETEDIDITGFNLDVGINYELFPEDTAQSFIIPGGRNIVFAKDITELPQKLQNPNNVLIQIANLKIVNSHITLKDQIGSVLAEYDSSSKNTESKNSIFTDSLVSTAKIYNPTQNSVDLSWETLTPAISIVKYGTQPDHLNETVIDSTPKTEHKLTVKNLKPGTDYYFQHGARIGSTDIFGMIKNMTTLKSSIISLNHITRADYDGYDNYFLGISDKLPDKVKEPTVKQNLEKPTLTQKIKSQEYPTTDSKNSMSSNQGFKIAIYGSLLFILFIVGKYIYRSINSYGLDLN